MKRILYIFFYIFLFFSLISFPAAAQTSASSDIIVLLDTSASVLPYFQNVTDNVLTKIATDYARFNDTFHLISFGSGYKLETVKNIKTKDDIREIVSRFFLLYPLDGYTDLLSALQYAYQYTSALRVSSPKQIIIISDGVQDPPPESVTAKYQIEEIKNDVNAVASRMRAAGWNVYFMKLPFPEGTTVVDLDGNVISDASQTRNSAADRQSSALARQSESGAESRRPSSAGQTARDTEQSPASGSADTARSNGGAASAADTRAALSGESGEEPVVDISGEFAKNLDITPIEAPADAAEIKNLTQKMLVMPEITFPQDIGKKGYQFSLPLDIKNPSDGALDLELNRVYLNGENVLKKSAFLNLDAREESPLKIKLKIPEDIPEGRQNLHIELGFAQNIRSLPQEGDFWVTLKTNPVSAFFKKAGFVALAIILIAFAALLIIIVAILVHRNTSSESQSGAENARIADNAERGEEKTRTSARGQTAPSAAQSESAGGSSSAQKNNSLDASENHSYAKTESRNRANAASGKNDSESGSASKQDKSSPYEAAKYASSAAGAETAALNTANTAAGQNQSAARGDDSALRDAAKNQQSGDAALLNSAGQNQNAARYDDSALRDAAKNQQSGDAALLNSAGQKQERPAAGFEAASATEAIPIARDAKTTLELCVYNQSTAIGKRNVHMIKAGGRLSIGGASSAFLIFLVDFPRKIAEIRFNGERCDLAILKPQYFPYETKNIIENCIGREVCVVSDKGYPVTFVFREYEDPVKKLNDLLTSIKYD